MDSTTQCWLGDARCPTQFCHGYNVTLCYEQVNKTEQVVITKFLCPSINLCITTGCPDLQQLLTPAYLNLTGSNKYDLTCVDKENANEGVAVQISPASSRGSMRGDTLVVLMAIGISLFVCGSFSV
jgi:hypothetical protein